MQYKPFELLNVEVCPSIYNSSITVKNTFYHHYLELKEKIESVISQVIVLANIPSKHLKKVQLNSDQQVLVKFYLDTNTKQYVQFPRDNTFEVYYMGECLHSKLKSCSFPNIDHIINKINLIRIQIQNNSLKPNSPKRNISKSKAKNLSQSPLSRKFLDEQKAIRKKNNKISHTKQTENDNTDYKKSNNINVNIIKVNNKVILRNRSYSPSPDTSLNRPSQHQVLPTCKFIKWFQSHCLPSSPLNSKRQYRENEVSRTSLNESEQQSPKNHNDFYLKGNNTGQNSILTSDISLGNSRKIVLYTNKGENSGINILNKNTSSPKIINKFHPVKQFFDEIKQINTDHQEEETSHYPKRIMRTLNTEDETPHHGKRIMRTQNTEDETPHHAKRIMRTQNTEDEAPPQVEQKQQENRLSFSQVSEIVQESYENKQQLIGKFRKITHRINFMLILGRYFREQKQLSLHKHTKLVFKAVILKNYFKQQIQRKIFLKLRFLKLFRKVKMMLILWQYLLSKKLAKTIIYNSIINYQQHSEFLTNTFIKVNRKIKMCSILHEKFYTENLSEKYLKVFYNRLLQESFYEVRSTISRAYRKFRMLSILIQDMFNQYLSKKFIRSTYEKSINQIIQNFKNQIRERVFRAYKKFRMLQILIQEFHQQILQKQSKLQKGVRLVQMGLTLKNFFQVNDKYQELSEGFKTERDILKNFIEYNDKDLSQVKFDSNNSFEDNRLNMSSNQSFECDKVSKGLECNSSRRLKISKQYPIKLRPNGNKSQNADISFAGQKNLEEIKNEEIIIINEPRKQQLDQSNIVPLIRKNMQKSLVESQKNFEESYPPLELKVVHSEINQSEFSSKQLIVPHVVVNMEHTEEFSNANMSDDQCSLKLEEKPVTKKKQNQLKQSKNLIFNFQQNHTEKQINLKKSKKKKQLNNGSMKQTVTDRFKKLESRFEILEQVLSSYHAVGTVTATDIPLEPTSKAMLLKLLDQNKEKRYKAQQEGSSKRII